MERLSDRNANRRLSPEVLERALQYRTDGSRDEDPEAVRKLRQSDGAGALEVRDDGVGIDPDVVWAEGAAGPPSGACSPRPAPWGARALARRAGLCGKPERSRYGPARVNATAPRPPVRGPIPSPPPSPAPTTEPLPPLYERVASLRAYVRTFPTVEAAAAALDVSVGTLRRNLDHALATDGALDVIAERVPSRTPPGHPTA